jgi:hypothetical protein
VLGVVRVSEARAARIERVVAASTLVLLLATVTGVVVLAVYGC